jgi:hypothetical protein
VAGRGLRIVAFVGALAACTLGAPGGRVHAQTPQELDDARKLFGDALKDEEDRRYADALEKFRRVQRVRDTIAVRYRIATCLEGLRKLRDAQVAFAAIGAEPNVAGDDVETVRSAAARANDIAARLPRLTLRLSPRAPADAVVRVVDQIVLRDALDALVLDPGEHVIDASGTGALPFHTRIALEERARVEIAVTLDATAPAASASAAPSASASPAASGDGARTTWGTVAIVGGGALIGASVITALLRAGDIGKLHDNCTNNVCPASQEADLTSTRRRALVEGPLAAVFGVAGVAAAGVGLYLLMVQPSSSPTKGALSVILGADGVLRVRGAF